MANSNRNLVGLPDHIFQNEHKTIQSRRLGILAGLLMASLGALMWGLYTTYTGSQAGYFALFIGVAVGISVKQFGQGCTACFIIIGGMLTVLGSITGNYLSIVGLFAHDQDTGLFEVWSSIDHNAIPGLVCSNFQIRDIFYFSAAAFIGARLAKASIYYGQQER